MTQTIEQQPSSAALAAASAALEGRTPQEILRWAAGEPGVGGEDGRGLKARATELT